MEIDYVKRNNKINLCIMSRKKAYEYCKAEHNNKSVIISISTPYIKYPDKPYKVLENNVQDILSLTFSDADRPYTKDVYGKYVSEDDLLSDDMAKQIIDFVRKYKDHLIIIHCDAGISRSAGIGAAILKYYTGDDSQIFDNPQYIPNRWCYNKVLKAFYKNY